MIDSLYHLVGNLLSDLDSGIVGSLLFVVAGIGSVVQTFHKVGHIGGVYAHTRNHVFFETLGLRKSHGVAHRVYIALEVGLRSGVAARIKRCGNDSHSGYDCHFLHLYTCFVEWTRLMEELQHFDELYIEHQSGKGRNGTACAAFAVT